MMKRGASSLSPYLSRLKAAKRCASRSSTAARTDSSSSSSSSLPSSSSPTDAPTPFSNWYEKEERDEKNRLRLAAFLDSLYQKNATVFDSSRQTSTHASSAPAHEKKYTDSLSSLGDFELFLNTCLDQELIVHEKALHTSIVKAERFLRDKHNINAIPKDVKKVVIVGDLHGDLSSLAHIVRKNGLPGPHTAFVFNGDMVDRGIRGGEVLYFILQLLLQYPKRVFINRGNHEDTFLNAAYGFKDELYTKYGVANGRVLRDSLSRLYTSIPLCCWDSSTKTFISHAGPPLLLPGPNTPFFNGNRSFQPWGDISSIKRRSCVRTTADALMEALTWSDPHPDPTMTGLQVNGSRGAGLCYGTDVLEQWMEAVGVATFVRSHQCIQFGSERTALQSSSRSSHTVFSSANYRGAGNEGAYLVLSSDGLDTQRFHADDIPPDKYASSVARDPHCHDAYSKEVVTSIFRALDKDSLGFLTLDEIERALILAGEIGRSKDFDHGCVVENMGIGMSLDLRQWLEKMDSGDGKVSIDEFLRLFM